MKRFYITVSAFALLFLAGCTALEEKGDTFTPLLNGTPVEDGQVFNMEVGESFTIGSYDGKEPATDFEWSSSDETVALVSHYGLIQALHGGEATITLKHKPCQNLISGP